MTEAKIDFPKSSASRWPNLFVVEDPEFGKEALVRFSDGTQLSIAVGVRQLIDARYCNEQTPDLPISHRRSL